MKSFSLEGSYLLMISGFSFLFLAFVQFFSSLWMVTIYTPKKKGKVFKLSILCLTLCQAFSWSYMRSFSQNMHIICVQYNLLKKFMDLTGIF